MKAQEYYTENYILLQEENYWRIKVYVPYYKQAWMDCIKAIPGRAWNAEQKYWSLPYVEETFTLLQEAKEIPMKFAFQKRSDIPTTYAPKKKSSSPSLKKKYPLLLLY